MLLICFCHLSCLSTVTASKRCPDTCSIGVDVSRFVLVGFGAIKYVQHHLETPLRLCCKSLRKSHMSLLDVLRVPSSANKSYWTDVDEMRMGRSLIKTHNRRGPRIGPWGTPHVIGFSWEYVPFTSTHCWRPCKWDQKKVIPLLLTLYSDNLVKSVVIIIIIIQISYIAR